MWLSISIEIVPFFDITMPRYKHHYEREMSLKEYVYTLPLHMRRSIQVSCHIVVVASTGILKGRSTTGYESPFVWLWCIYLHWPWEVTFSSTVIWICWFSFSCLHWLASLYVDLLTLCSLCHLCFRSPVNWQSVIGMRLHPLLLQPVVLAKCNPSTVRGSALTTAWWQFPLFPAWW